jgi:hypothetical protein
MASGTADLQRDLGGAIMQSIFGALLTAGYATAVSAAIASAPASEQDQITNSVQTQLQKSMAGADAVAAQYPKYSSEIIAAAKSSFLDGADWAYLAGILAIALGAVIVFFMFPRRDAERALLRQYHDEDAAADSS